MCQGFMCINNKNEIYSRYYNISPHNSNLTVSHPSGVSRTGRTDNTRQSGLARRICFSLPFFGLSLFFVIYILLFFWTQPFTTFHILDSCHLLSNKIIVTFILPLVLCLHYITQEWVVLCTLSSHWGSKALLPRVELSRPAGRIFWGRMSGGRIFWWPLKPPLRL